MKTTSWLSAAVVCAAVGGAGGQNPTPAPPPREKPTDEAWLPKPRVEQGGKGGLRIVGIGDDTPSAFPNLVPPVPDYDVKDRKEMLQKHAAEFARMCPRLYGTIMLKIEPTDDTLRKLLKARLHQGTLEFQLIQRVWSGTSGPAVNLDRHRECLLDMQAAATELWTNRPKELIPWLEELLLAAKDLERLMGLGVLTATRTPDEYTATRRLRLKMEAELWKAKNPK